MALHSAVSGSAFLVVVEWPRDAEPRTRFGAFVYFGRTSRIDTFRELIIARQAFGLLRLCWSVGRYSSSSSKSEAGVTLMDPSSRSSSIISPSGPKLPMMTGPCRTIFPSRHP